MKKKILSVLLSTMMIAGYMVLPASAEIESNPGVLLNGGFEECESGTSDYKYGWDYTAFNVASNLAHTGSRSAYTQGSYAPIFQTVDVLENTEYTFSFWYKKSNDTADNAGVMIYDEKFESMDNRADAGVILGTTTNDFIPLTTTTDWQMYAHTFNSGANSKITFVVRRQGTGSNGSGNSVYFDDFMLTPCKESFANPYFNLGLEGWAQENGVTYVADGGHDGYAAALNDGLSATYQSLSQTILVEKNKDYTVSYWYKNENYGHNFTIYGANYTKENANESKIKEVLNHTSTAGWVKQIVDFNSAENESLTFVIDNCNTKSVTYFDDFKFGETPIELKDGSFESDQDTVWIRNGSHGIAIQNYASRTGSTSLNINKSANYKHYIEQKVKVDKNTLYRLTYWYKGGDNKLSTAKHIIRVYGAGAPEYKNPDYTNATAEWYYNDNATKTAIINKTVGDADEWTKQIIEFNSGNNEILSVRFLAGSYDGKLTESSFVDDIELVAATDVKNDVFDSGFEFGHETEGAWKRGDSGSAVYTVNYDSTNSGSELAIRHESSYKDYIQQTVKVDKNTRFKLSYIYKDSTTTAADKHMVKVFGENPTSYTRSTATEDLWQNRGNALVHKTFTAEDTWTKAEFEFNSSDNEEITIRFLPGHLNATTSDATNKAHTYIDDVKLEIIEPAFPYITIKQTRLFNSQGTRIYGVEETTDGKMQVKVWFESLYADDVPANIFVAVYNDGKLYTVKQDNGGNAKLISNNIHTNYVMDMVIDNLPTEGMTDKWSVSVFTFDGDKITPLALKGDI